MTLSYAETNTTKERGVCFVSLSQGTEGYCKTPKDTTRLEIHFT